MLPDKSILLEQITTAIHNNSCKNCSDNTEGSGGNVIEFNNELNGQHFFSHTRNQELLKKLEDRIGALEEQNDRLLYFIHFLYKNFPDLVNDILTGDIKEPRAPDTPADYGLHPKPDTPAVTRREIEILHLLVKGLCAKEIATMLFISETTVITHKKHLKEKFHARNTVELISKAFTILSKK